MRIYKFKTQTRHYGTERLQAPTRRSPDQRNRPNRPTNRSSCIRIGRQEALMLLMMMMIKRGKTGTLGETCRVPAAVPETEERSELDCLLGSSKKRGMCHKALLIFKGREDKPCVRHGFVEQTCDG